VIRVRQSLLAVVLMACALLQAPVASAGSQEDPTPYCPNCVVTGTSSANGIDTTTAQPGSQTAPAAVAAAGTGGAAVPVGAGAGAPAGPSTYYEDRPICYASAAGEGACATAYTCPDPGSYRAWVYAAPTPTGPWANTGQQVCTTGTTIPGAPPATTRPPTDAELLTRAAHDHYPIDPPTITTNPADPADPAIAQLPTILSTQPQTALDRQQTELGITETVHITPRWHWDLDDPTAPTLDASTSGRAYDRTDPVDHPQHYLLHTWHTRGSKTVTLTVTWTATLTRHDTGTTITLPGATLRRATRTLQVREGRAELTSP